MRVLDVATGPGFGAGAAAARGVSAGGVDFSGNMLAQARRLHPAATFRPGEAEALPFADGEFDAVICKFGLLHFAESVRVAAEAVGVPRRGGACAVTV